MKDRPADPWRSIPYAAEYLGVSRDTIRNYIAKGLLPASRIAGSKLTRIRQSDLDALMRPA